LGAGGLLIWGLVRGRVCEFGERRAGAQRFQGLVRRDAWMVAGPAGWLRESGSRLPHSKAFGWLVRRGYSAPLQGWVIYVIGYLGRCPRLVWSCAVGAQEGGLGEGAEGKVRSEKFEWRMGRGACSGMGTGTAAVKRATSAMALARYHGTLTESARERDLAESERRCGFRKRAGAAVRAGIWCLACCWLVSGEPGWYSSRR
jgi:hypothetical protein